MTGLINLTELVFMYIGSTVRGQDLTPAERLVLIYLAHRGRWYDSTRAARGESYPSLQRIGRDTGIGKSRAVRAVAKLSEAGLIEIIKTENRHHSNIYRINEAELLRVSGVDVTRDGKSLISDVRGSKLAPQRCQTDTPTIHMNNYYESEVDSVDFRQDPEVMEILSLWKETAEKTGLSYPRRITQKLALKVRNAIDRNGIDVVKEAVTAPLRSRFLSGKVKTKYKWNGATLVWVIDEDNISKIIAGMYYDKPAEKQGRELKLEWKTNEDGVAQPVVTGVEI